MTLKVGDIVRFITEKEGRELNYRITSTGSIHGKIDCIIPRMMHDEPKDGMVITYCDGHAVKINLESMNTFNLYSWMFVPLKLESRPVIQAIS